MSKTILLIEDEDLVAEGLHFMIRRSCPEFTVIGCAQDGSEGLAAAEALKPDIVLTDILMPTTNGLDMIGRIQELGLDCSFIILSGHANFSYAQRAMLLGVRHYLTKPVSEIKLVETIRLVWTDLEKEREQRRQLALLRAAKQPPVPEAAQSTGNDEDTVQCIKNYICKHYSEQITLKELSSVFYLNSSYISQLFKNKTGETYISYLTEIRMKEACRLLESTNMKIVDICEQIGYNDFGNFSKAFKRETGMRPNQYRMKMQDNS